MQEVRYRFHNVNGMRSDKEAREAYLRGACDVCDVLVLADGIYTKGASGSSVVDVGKAITIRAQNPGQAVA